MRTFWKSMRAGLTAAALCLVGTTWSLAADSAADAKAAQGNMTDYMLSYLIVIMAIALGLLVVAKASNRRDRERPAGYVEKNVLGDD